MGLQTEQPPQHSATAPASALLLPQSARYPNCSLLLLSCVQLFVTPWTAAHQALLSTDFSRQERWSGLLLPSPGHLPNPGIKAGCPSLQANSLLSEPPGKPVVCIYVLYIYVNLELPIHPLPASSWFFFKLLFLRREQNECRQQYSFGAHDILGGVSTGPFSPPGLAMCM